MSMTDKNRQADQQINQAVGAFQEAASGGLNVMQLAMNPTGAMEKFGGPLMQLVQGLQLKNAIITDLLQQVQSLSRELEGIKHG